jgi:hypothetical protein
MQHIKNKINNAARKEMRYSKFAGRGALKGFEGRNYPNTKKKAFEDKAAGEAAHLKSEAKWAAKERNEGRESAVFLVFWAIVSACIAGGIGTGGWAVLFGLVACVLVVLAIWTYWINRAA